MSSPEHISDPLAGLSLERLRFRTSEKWRRYDPDVLPLWVAEMDCDIAEPIIDAVTAALRLGDTGYTYGDDYQQALKDFYRIRWSSDFAAERADLAGDVMHGITALIEQLTNRGGAVIVNSPVYPPFYLYPKQIGREVVESPLGADGRIDFEQLEHQFAAQQGKRAVYLMSNPHNPTGVLHRKDELEQVAALAEQYGIAVIADEIHAPLVSPELRFTPYLTVAGDSEAFSVFAASKAWNLAGIKAAVVASNEAGEKTFKRYRAMKGIYPSQLGVIAHVAAMRHGIPWLDALLPSIERNKYLLKQLLDQHLPAAQYRIPEATYLAWVDVRPLDLGPWPANLLVEQARVAFNAGEYFGSGGAGHIRINLGTSPEIITEAIERTAAAINR